MSAPLASQGYRFIRRDGSFDWVSPEEVQPSDLDCTDMNFAQLAQAIVEVEEVA